MSLALCWTSFAQCLTVLINSNRQVAYPGDACLIDLSLRSDPVSKHDLLTEEEFESYVPNANVMRDLSHTTRAMGSPPEEMRVLDWGCGRGRDVLFLREMGYEAYGIDIDPLPVQNGLPLFLRKGYSSDCLALLDQEGRTPFPDGFFDYVFSGNVLEHVSDIYKVSEEIARITRQGGSGYHVFPAQRQPMEGHLFMPFVHWLPEGLLRRTLIHIFVLLGREPNWIEVREASALKKTAFYYQYTVNNIFYRPYSKVRKAFEVNGISVTFTTIDHPKIKANPIIARALPYKPFRGLLHHFLLTYKLVEMQLRKI
jgi:SAM-dependent methyltransferase